jgi:hypothetical protein
MNATMEKLLSFIPRLPEFQRAVAQEAADLADKRKQAMVEIAEISKTGAKQIAALQKTEAEAKQALADAKRVFEQRQRESDLATLAVANASAAHERELGERRSYLHETAPAAIGDYLAELLKFHNDARRTTPSRKLPDGATAFASIGQRQAQALDEIWRAVQPLKDLLALISSTIALVKRMRFEVLTPADAEREIASHRRCIASAAQRAGIVSG